ncbi:MAG: hypothetical protein WC971_08535 [Coriobacteriia bacterium]
MREFLTDTGGWFWAIAGAILGVMVGVLAEKVWSVCAAMCFMLRFKKFAGTYRHDGGTVIVKTHRSGRFETEGREIKPENNWSGSFRLDDSFLRTARGGYEHTSRAGDWGYHYVKLLDNGDISVQWENVSGGQRLTGALVWRRER